MQACPNCRAPVSPEDGFCERCGQRLSVPVATGAAPRVLIIGRAEGCDILLDAGQVSGQHAVLVLGPQGAFLEDRNSTSGTFVRGQRIQSATPVGPGDTIGFGSYTISFEDLVRRIGGRG
jgi:pSer/pThr/pTyr-binding forkhead associated (FHA) protein